MSLAASKRANELEQALNAWEDNRLLTSGVVKLKQVRLCRPRCLFGLVTGGGVSAPETSVCARPGNVCTSVAQGALYAHHLLLCLRAPKAVCMPS
jgi:hypothetical protein